MINLDCTIDKKKRKQISPQLFNSQAFDSEGARQMSQTYFSKVCLHLVICSDYPQFILSLILISSLGSCISL